MQPMQTPDSNQPAPADYHAWLLRLWREGERGAWRASLQARVARRHRADRDGGREQPELRHRQRAVQLHLEDREELGRELPPADRAPRRRHRAYRQLQVQVKAWPG